MVKKIIDEAKSYHFASVCVNPVWVNYCAQELVNSGVKVCTVIGFPLGANTTATKVFETKDAIENGADEIDMVINIGEEIIRACKLAKEAKADFVKTSTGFSTMGATASAVALMKKTVGDNLEVKASGGVRNIEDMEELIKAGATRIGTSAGCKLAG